MSDSRRRDENGNLSPEEVNGIIEERMDRASKRFYLLLHKHQELQKKYKILEDYLRESQKEEGYFD